MKPSYFAALVCLCVLTTMPLPSRAMEINVVAMGARADSKTDSTLAFQTALNRVHTSGGGKVKVPFGSFLIGGHLTIPMNVALVGEWEAPPAPTRLEPTPGGKQAGSGVGTKHALIAGSVLLAVEGAGNEKGVPFITMERNSTLKGLIVYYPNQITTPAPKPYPWTVRGIGDNVSIVDCLLVNPYMAVDLGTNPCGRHYVRGLYAQAIFKGLFVDKCYDVGRLENIHFWPFWSAHLTPAGSDVLDKWMQQNATAFILSRSDWEYVSNCFCISYGTGFVFKSSAPDGPGNYLLSQSGADNCDVAVNVVETQGHSGVSFSNSQLFGRILVGPKNYGPIRFSACGLFGCAVLKSSPDSEVILIDGGGRVSFDNCHFYAIFGKTNTPVFIRQVGGRLNVNNSLYIVNQFLDPVPLVIEKGAITTIYTQNEHYTTKHVVNNRGETERVIIKDNVYSDTR